MNKSKIIVYGLLGCEKCENVAKKFRELLVDYEFIDCSGYNEICHDLELLTGAIDYPIVVVNDVVIYQLLNYSKSAATRRLNDKLNGIGVLTVHELISAAVVEYKKYHTP
jgi:glutaredoxin